MKTLEKGKTKI